MKKNLKWVITISILMSLCTYIIASNNFSNKQRSMIQYYTRAYDTFTSWDWLVDPSTNLALGNIKEGALLDYQHKIHPINLQKPNEWSEGEYYCDPDSIIVAYNGDGKYNSQYLPYMKWNKDYFIQKDGKLGRFSVRYDPNTGNKYFNQTNPLQLEVREDHTIQMGQPYIETTISIKNLYDTEMNILYIYQDAAFMWLPDGNQQHVGTYINSSKSEIVDKFWFGINDPTVIAGTYHKMKNVFGGIYTSNPYAFIGIIPEYAYFIKHLNRQDMANKGVYGYAEVNYYKKTKDELVEYLSQWNGREITKDDLKNRIVVLPIDNLKPGETRIIEFRRTGYMNLNSKKTDIEWVRSLNIDNAQ